MTEIITTVEQQEQLCAKCLLSPERLCPGLKLTIKNPGSPIQRFVRERCERLRAEQNRDPSLKELRLAGVQGGELIYDYKDRIKVKLETTLHLLNGSKQVIKYPTQAQVPNESWKAANEIVGFARLSNIDAMFVVPSGVVTSERLKGIDWAELIDALDFIVVHQASEPVPGQPAYRAVLDALQTRLQAGKPTWYISEKSTSMHPFVQEAKTLPSISTLGRSLLK